MAEVINNEDSDSDSSGNLPDLESTSNSLHQERLVDSDSSDGFPDLLTIFPDLCKERTFDGNKLKKDDIVWAKYKNLYWPALVRSVNKKGKKAQVWYLDSPKKCFKVPFSKIHDFDDAKFTFGVRTRATSHPLGELHDKVYTRTTIFIQRKLAQHQDDPVRFFDLSMPYLLCIDYGPESSALNSNSEKISTEKSDGENVNSIESAENNNIIENKSDVETSSEDESYVKKRTSAKESIPEFYKMNCPYDDEMIEKILSYIKAGHVDKYLVDIKNFKIKNERHENYVRASETGTKEEVVWQNSPEIPIDNEKLIDVLFHLEKVLELNFGKYVTYSTEYLAMVWLPEAIDKAISMIEGESLKLPANSGSNASSSHLGEEATELPIDSSIDKASNSPILVESPNLVINSDSSNILTSPFQVEASKFLTNSSSSGVFTASKRKRNLVSSLLKNNNSDVQNIKTCASDKKKFAVGKKQEVQSRVLRSSKTTFNQKMIKPLEENLFDSPTTVKASDNKAVSSNNDTRASNKKKLAVRKKQEVQSRVLRSAKTTFNQKRAKPLEENLFASTSYVKASRSKAAFKKFSLDIDDRDMK